MTDHEERKEALEFLEENWGELKKAYDKAYRLVPPGQAAVPILRDAFVIGFLAGKKQAAKIADQSTNAPFN